MEWTAPNLLWDGVLEPIQGTAYRVRRWTSARVPIATPAPNSIEPAHVSRSGLLTTGNIAEQIMRIADNRSFDAVDMPAPLRQRPINVNGFATGFGHVG